jgi:hypothetical protein
LTDLSLNLNDTNIDVSGEHLNVNDNILQVLSDIPEVTEDSSSTLLPENSGPYLSKLSQGTGITINFNVFKSQLL